MTPGVSRLAYAVQFFFGGWFFYNGLNHFVAFTAAPPGSSPGSRELIAALEHSGLFAVVKAVELASGALLLANRFVPLAIAAAAPVAFAIAWVMLVVNGGKVGTIVGLLVPSFMGIMVWARLGAFRPLLAWDEQSGRAIPAPASLAPLGRQAHLIAVLLGIAAPVAIELGTMSYFQSVANHSKPPQEAARTP